MKYAIEFSSKYHSPRKAVGCFSGSCKFIAVKVEKHLFSIVAQARHFKLHTDAGLNLQRFWHGRLTFVY